MYVAVILPSRGLIYSRTAEEIIRNLRGIPHRFFFAHKLPLPDCFELPTLQALQDPDITHFWFVEDDMIIPDNVLEDMLFENTDVVTCDYPVSKDGKGAIFAAEDGTVLYGGTGCLLVTREAIEKLPKPLFRTDIRWIPSNHKEFIKLTAADAVGKGDEYGLHDVTFYMKLHKSGANITLLPTKLGQRKLIKLGESGTNNGAHQVENWTEFEFNKGLQYVKTFATDPSDNLTTVRTKTGDVRATKAHAQKLIKAGKGTIPEQTTYVLDYGDYDL